MCFVTIITKIFAEITLSDIGNLVTISVGITTIIYNLYKIKEQKRK